MFTQLQKYFCRWIWDCIEVFRAPSVEPPNNLHELSRELFPPEQTCVAARFKRAVRLSKEAFVGEFGKLVWHLTERIKGSGDGKPKVFRDSTVENLGECFQRFR